MKYQVQVRTSCAAPHQHELIKVVYAQDIFHAEEVVLSDLRLAYPECDDLIMWEIVSVSSMHE